MYKPGTILKVTVKNFVTYSYAEMYPGPNLNMLIGPNGTGKSTIVAAIILGLGGNPKIIGRGSKVSEYVKHNRSDASIDILLHGDNEGSSFNITREFNIHEKNTWKLNNKKSSLTEIYDYVKKYNIQVNNLCQFLPQDRVQDFAKMNKQELLKQTKIAICRDDLLAKQQDLIKKRERHKELLAGLDKQIQKLQECRDSNVRLEGKVKNFNKKKKYLNHIKGIERKIAWLEYESVSERREEIKADRSQAREIYDRHSNAGKPIENAISNARKNFTNFQAKSLNTVNAMKNAEALVNNNCGNYGRLKDSITAIKNDMNAKLCDIEQRECEINSSTMKLDQLNTDKAEIINKCGSEITINDKMQRFNQEIRKITSQVTTIEEQKDEINGLKRENSYKVRGLENELRRIENVKQQRLDWLRNADPDAHKATLWLRENKHLFKGEVYEPMMLELNVTNPENSVYIENTVPVRDRVAFTCTLKEDMNVLIKMLRGQQHLSVNVVHSGNEQQPFQSYQPIIPIEQLKRYGFFAYLHSLFTGPEPIMKYLCKTYRIHCTPVGNQATNRCFEDVPREISNFFSDKFRFSTSCSKYTGEKSTRQSEIKSDGSLSVSVDAIRLDHIKGQLTEARQACDTNDDEIRELDNRITQLKERNTKLNTHLQGLRNSHQQILTIESRIRVVNNKLQQLREEIMTIEEVKQEADKKIQKVVQAMLTIQEKITKAYREYANLTTEDVLNTISLDIFRKQVVFLENKAIDVRRLCQEAEETLNHIKDLYNRVTEQAKAALQKAKNLSNGHTPTDEGFQEFRQAYDSLQGNLEELVAEKDHMLSKIDCLQTADDGEMREYEERLKQIEKLEEYINDANSEKNEISATMDQLKEEYMTPLEELVNEISQRFSAAFERMGCSGEVIIYTGEDDKDYEQYGLSIRVTYRNGEPLQELNNVTQSGGERAVATATYMLSLQELTPVPFRCVDEINQGMDASNERRIFELLVDSTSQPNTPQYFLITPKLIPNLKFVPTMKIHVVHNGPFMISQTEWNTVSI